MRTPIVSVAVLVFSLLGCGSSDPPDTDSATPSSSTSDPASEPTYESRSETTVTSRAVIELKISGIDTAQKADEVRRKLKGVDGVEEVRVDFGTPGGALEKRLGLVAAKCLMKPGIKIGELADVVKDLRGVLGTEFQIVGFSSDFHETTEHFSVEKWSRGE